MMVRFIPVAITPAHSLNTTFPVPSDSGDRVAALGCYRTSFAVLLRRESASRSLSGMSYQDKLPAYSYELPCGHPFRSMSRSAPSDDGRHWFWCRHCHSYTALDDGHIGLYESPPRHPSGKRMSDAELARNIDLAIKRDRIAAYYRLHWANARILDVAKALGVSEKLVRPVAAALGVYDHL